MTAKEYLSQGWLLDQRIDARIAERERLMAKVTAARSPSLSGMPRGGKHDWTDAVDRAADLSAEIDADIKELCRLKREIGETIERVDDYKCRTLLELRYRNYYTWERIAEELHYEVRQVYRLHGEALQKVALPA
jgi:hypothetical protein